MWALRRASIPLRYRELRAGTAHACFSKTEKLLSNSTGKAEFFECPQALLSRYLFHRATSACSKLSVGRCDLSSQAGSKSSGEEDGSEDGLSELEFAASADANQESSSSEENEDTLISEPELNDADEKGELSQNERELLDIEGDSVEKKSSRERVASALFQAIIASPDLPVHGILDMWVEEGKNLDRSEISLAMLSLRRQRMYRKALQLSEWLEENKKLDFVERDYASRVDLIAKSRGLERAESYIQKIPKSLQGEVVYRTLLANCVLASNLKKAEEVFDKMKDLDFPVTSFSCNQLLLLYKRFDKTKIADVLVLMEKENVSPSLQTYQILIDTKGRSNDIAGMEQVFETMKADGIDPDICTLALLAKQYASSGLKEKAHMVLKEIVGDNLMEKRWVCQWLFPIYAELGEADEVARVWKVCESRPWNAECLAAIEAWGKLKKIEEAEAVFDIMLNRQKKLPSKHYCALLRIYANEKMLDKAKDLVKCMANSGCEISPLTWDVIVNLCLEAGDVEMADSFLQKAVQQNQRKPLINSYIAIMDQYAKRGDVHNSEKMILRMRQAGYEIRYRQFQILIQAYTNAKTLAYGLVDRIKAANIFISKSLEKQLALVDPFTKTSVSDLLD